MPTFGTISPPSPPCLTPTTVLSSTAGVLAACFFHFSRHLPYSHFRRPLIKVRGKAAHKCVSNSSGLLGCSRLQPEWPDVPSLLPLACRSPARIRSFPGFADEFAHALFGGVGAPPAMNKTKGKLPFISSNLCIYAL